MHVGILVDDVRCLSSRVCVEVVDHLIRKKRDEKINDRKIDEFSAICSRIQKKKKTT